MMETREEIEKIGYYISFLDISEIASVQYLIHPTHLKVMARRD